MKLNRILIIAAAVVLGLGIGVRLLPGIAAPRFTTAPLTVTTDSGSHKLTVEVASSDAQQRYGLMFRRTLSPDKGMIFLFQEPQVIKMWMKNTYIPLDMVFLDATGTVTHVVANARPESTDIISSISPANGVIELAGGVAQKLGITMGDKIESPVLTPAATAAPATDDHPVVIQPASP